MCRAFWEVVRRAIPLAFAVAALAAAPGSARGAEPASGAVSAGSPAVTWSGTSSQGFFTTFGQVFINGLGGRTPCEAPSCDTFTLDVRTPGDLTVQVTSEASIAYLQVEKPDGGLVYESGTDRTSRLMIPGAPAGTYRVQTAVNTLAAEAYTGVAGLPAPPPAVAAPPPPPPPARPTTIGVRARRLSARKLRRTGRLPLTITAGARVTRVRIVLARDGRAIAFGRLASVQGRRRLALRLPRRLSRGRYDLVVEARDRDGELVGVLTRLRIRR